MKRISIISTMALVAVLSAGCEKEGPAEKAGKQIDEVTENIKQEGTDLGNAIEDACEDVKEDMGAEDKDC
ncbi:MAG TPA: hypothetical protein VFG52_10360 [Xanthomonadales bacterium]|nr:hypothetical protein [Xanthomonadales bacterium]